MITLHHLNRSRSRRILWLLEELGLDYEVVAYQRDPVTSLAPDHLKAVHPLGKAPVIDDDGRIIAESGHIVEYLIGRYGQGRLMPAPDSDDYLAYRQWIHFAESSAILPLLLKLFITKDGAKTTFLADYADREIAKILTYINDCLAGRDYFVGLGLSGADIMMSFIVESVQAYGLIDHYPHINRYAMGLQAIESYRQAHILEAEYDTTTA